jgi:hypothetical protein
MGVLPRGPAPLLWRVFPGTRRFLRCLFAAATGREFLVGARIFPLMVQLQYSAEMFTEILFTPRSTPGFAVLLDVNAPRPLRIYASFKPDLDLMWPGGLGGQTYTWDKTHRWLELAEPTNQFSASLDRPSPRDQPLSAITPI